MSALGVLLGPDPHAELAAAVTAAGADVVEDPATADVIVWRGSDHTRLAGVLERAPRVRWIQLGAAGTDAWAPTGMFGDGRVWTSAKGAYSEAVAEHALALTLALLRGIVPFARARRWTPPRGRNLYGATVLVLGASGGIGLEVIRLLQPFSPRILAAGRAGVVDETTGASLTLDDALPHADVVVVATPLTPDTRGIISRERLALMSAETVLVNVGRGALVDTDALVDALREGALGGAGLDVTDPEPLPENHPLWTLENCVVTPHTANTPEMLMPQLARRVTANLLRFAAGHPLLGVVDPAKGY